MRLRMNTVVYTNMMLSVIAVCLVALCLNTFRIQILRDAQAQENASMVAQRNATGFGTTGTAAPRSGFDVPQQSDPAVAAATQDVAAANREIAAAIRDLGSAMRDTGTAIGRAIGSSHGGAAPTIGPLMPSSSAPSSAPSSDAPAISIR